MLFLIWLVLCFGVVSLVLFLPALRLRDLYRRYSGGRLVTCPENHQSAVVTLDAAHLVATGLEASPNLRLSDCTRWPQRSGCHQGCLPDAAQSAPSATPEPAAHAKQIYHLPILLAAFAAWSLGAIWHAQYLFRPRWTAALGLTRAQMKQLAWGLSPHLLTAAACLLFAYGVAWLLAVSHRKGVLPGVLVSLLLFGALALTGSSGLARLPHDLLAMEAGYAVLATLLMGAIVGGFHGKLILPSH